MMGLGASVRVEGEGIVECTLRDDCGVKQRIKVRAFYIPTSKVRLFSPQSYFQQEGGDSLKLDKERSTFIFVSGKSITFNYAKGSNLLIDHASTKDNNKSIIYAFVSLSTTRKLTISKGQEELLLWHSIFGHLI